METTDERKGYISASALERIKLCPPSWNLSKLVPKEEGTALTKAANDIHAAAAGQDIELKRKDRELTETLLKQGDRIIAGILTVEENWEILEEKRDSERLWGGYGEKMWSGLFDRYVIAENVSTKEVVAIVLDYKTGWKEQTNPAENMQLRAASVLLKGRNPKIEKVYVALIERIKGASEAICYTNEDIDKARIEIISIITKGVQGDGDYNPSEKACQYCPAKTICPGIRKEHGAMVEKSKDLLPELLTDEELGKILTASPTVEKFIAACETEAKKRIEIEGKEIPAGDGKAWKLKPGSKTRKISDPQAAYQRLAKCIPIERFTACVTVKVGDLEDAYAEATGLKGKTCKDAFNAELNGVLTETQNKPTLVKA